MCRKNLKTQWLKTVLERRFPSQHGRLRGRARAGKGRDRPGCHPRGQERMLLHVFPVWPLQCHGTDCLRSRKQVIIKWRGKPVFVRHRTPDEIKAAEDTKWETLRDPQPDSDRVKKPEWLIMVGRYPLSSSLLVPTPPPLTKPILRPQNQTSS